MRLSDRLTDNTRAFVLAGGAGRRLSPLTKYRPKPLVPFGGCFRIIDFTLSNCFNSGLGGAYVLVQHEHESMTAYLRKGWSRLGTSREFAVPSPASSGKRYVGTADALIQNLPLVQERGSVFLLVVSADHVYKMDYRNILGFHVASGADVTIGAVPYRKEFSSETGVLEVDKDHRVVAFDEKPGSGNENSSVDKTVLVDMGVYVFNIDMLLSAVETSGTPLVDIVDDLIPHMMRLHKVKAYRHENLFNTHPLYWRDVGTLDAYYHANMDLLASNSPIDPFDKNWPIRSAFGMRFGGRSVLSEVGNEAGVDSIIPRAAYIEGASVFRSVLSSSVVLESGADVRHSVLLPGAVIRRGAAVRNAIIDAHVVIEAGDCIGYNKDRDHARFHVSPKGTVVVSPDHVAPFFRVDSASKAEVAL
jgi:glucose-1-phosphate adenylyltransferase